MALYVAFYNKASGELVPPARVDNGMRIAFGVEPDPVNWYANWFDTVGLLLAAGRDDEFIRESLADYGNPADKVRAYEYVLATYRIENWSGR